MTTLNTPNGFTGDLFFEEVLRKFLVYQLQQIKNNITAPGETFFDELFGRYGSDVILQIKEWFSTSTIPVTIDYPRDNMKIPMLCVVHGDETEKSDEAYLDDYGGTLSLSGRSVVASSQLKTAPNAYGTQLAMPDNRPRALKARRLLSVPENHTTRIYVATDNVNSTLYLYALVKALLLVNKIAFDKYNGARNLKINGSDFEHKPELFPDFAYFRVVNLSYDVNFDVPLTAELTIGGVNVSFESFMENGTTLGADDDG